MKNTYLVLSLVLLVAVALFFGLKGKNLEAPIFIDDNQGISNDNIPETPIISGDNDSNNARCTEEAKLCPDGSYVGRTGPKCEFAACPVSTGTQSVKEFLVTGENFSFKPNLITVKKGDKVKITFKNTAGFHDFVIDEYGASTKQTQAPTTEVLEFTADKIGTFEYYCSVGSHRTMGMVGTLKVE
jgi:plastocyanin